MSRLSEIKNRIELWKIDPERAQILTWDDIHWLIARVERLAEGVGNMSECENCRKLQEREAAFREALKYYDDEILYDPELILGDGTRPGRSHWTKTAREVLERFPEEKEDHSK